MAGKKILTRSTSNGVLVEITTPQSSSDSPAQNDVPSLGTGGKVDNTLLNATDTSAGAGDAAKLVVLDGSGRIDNTMMPVGVGADTKTITASEALSAGDFVNVWNSGGSLRVRKADWSAAGKDSHGFVLSSVSNGAPATVYFEGANTQQSSLTTGNRAYGDPSNPGKAVTTYPTYTAGQVSQFLGVSVSTTEVNFEPGDPITVA